ncbi:MAG: hypothetical protein NC231_13175 [Bacillus sp. (in: Bacteria)]|nr:hypothetical protein [Bacillus sp. (in: firmicutes)]
MPENYAIIILPKRNALVRANYNDLKNDVHATTEFLELFLKNLLLDEKNELHNRSMHISGIFKEYRKTDNSVHEPDIDTQKPYIGIRKPDIDADVVYSRRMQQYTKKTIRHMQDLFRYFGKERIFGRSAVKERLGIQDSAASELLKKLLEADVIEPVAGYGKGKYRFR